MHSQQTSAQNKAPIVSFILTYYNLPVEMLRQCIESIKALSLRPYEREIIVVDDGSAHSPLPDLTDYLDDIIYIRQKNGGLSTARNCGIQAARGQYLQFIDADDMLSPVAYEHCLDLVRYGHTDMVLFDFADADSADNSAVHDDMPPMSGSEMMHNHNIHGTAWGYLFRRAILGELRFTPGIYHEDEEFTPQLLLRADTVQHTNAKAYLYRKRDNSITTSTDIRHRLKRLNDLLQVIFGLQQKASTLPNNERLALMRRVHQLTMDYIYNVIQLTGNSHYLERKLKVLRAYNLYPLPKRNYTQKYNWFRRLANSNIGLSMLMRAIPLISKEK